MILVTGGAGSIGSELVRKLASDGQSVRVMDISEEGLWSLKAELPETDIQLGDVQSLDDVRRACQGVSSVVHCAALKHVDLCEQSPAIARHVNVDGTTHVLLAASEADARVVFVSTDKAIEPVSVMGQTKQQAEQLVIQAGGNVVRFGNVIGTKGSLLPMVLRCKALGKNISLTDGRMTRFFMSTHDAIGLIQEAMNANQGGRVFTPLNPRSASVASFVWTCVRKFAPELDVVITGMRPGERLHEPMQMRDGEIVWSDWPLCQMTLGDLEKLIIHCAPARAREAA